MKIAVAGTGYAKETKEIGSGLSFCMLSIFG